MGFKESLLDFFTNLFLRYQGLKIREIITYNYKNFSRKIYIYNDDSEKSKKIGQATPFGTILMSKSIFDKYSKNVVDYVFLHEIGHTSLHVILRILFYIVFLSSFTYAIISFFYIIVTLFTLLFGIILLSYFFSSLIFYISCFAIFSIVSMLSSWIYELHADLFAYGILGKSQYLNVLAELDEKKGDIKKWYIVWRRYLYPPKPLFWYFARARNL